MRSWPAFILLVLLAFPAAALEPYLVKDIDPVPAPDGSEPASFVTLRGAALFVADDGLSGRELWRSDGTAAGTWQVADLCKPDCSGNPGYFALTDRLYFFNGSATGTVRVSDFALEGPLSSLEWTVASGQLLFQAADEQHGDELWRTDGTSSGTRLVKDTNQTEAGTGSELWAVGPPAP